MIFNAHPALYAGDASVFAHPIMSIGTNDDGDKGILAIGDRSFDTNIH